MDESLTTAERRLTLRLLCYWEKLRGTRTMPHAQEIRCEDIPELWHHCFFVMFRDKQGKTYDITHLGEAIKEAFSPSCFAEGCSKLMETAKPVIEEGASCDTMHHGQLIKYRHCLLPLGENDDVNAVFGTINFRLADALSSITSR